MRSGLRNVSERVTRFIASRSGEAVIVPALLLVAAFWRLAYFNQNPYRYDDHALYTIVWNLTHGGPIPTTGLTSSIGLPNGPFQALLLAPFGLVDASPALMSVGTGMLNVLAAALLYGFARDFFGRNVATLALALDVVNPWSTVLSRRLLGNDMVAPFAVLSLWMAARWALRHDERAGAVLGAALAIGGQVYVLGLESLALVPVAVALRGRTALRWSFLIGASIFAALMIPYLATAAVPHMTTLLRVRDQAYVVESVDANSLVFALELASSEGYQTFAMQIGGHLDVTSGVAGLLNMLQRLLYAAGIAWGVAILIRSKRAIGSPERGIHLMMLTMLAVPVVVLIHHTVPIQPLYLVSTFPLPYVYGAFGLVRSVGTLRLAPRVAQFALRLGATGIVGAVLALNTLVGVLFFQVTGEYWAYGNYGLPWNVIDGAVQQSRSLEALYGLNRITVLDHANDFDLLAWALQARLKNVSDFDDTAEFVRLASPALYIAPGNDLAQQRLLREFGAQLVHVEVLAGDGTAIRYYVLPPSPIPPMLPAHTMATDWTISQGPVQAITLDGIALPNRIEPGQSSTITLYFTADLTAQVTNQGYSAYVHLVDSSGKQVGGLDRTIWPAQYWTSGDQFAETFPVSVAANAAPGVVTAQFGVYQAWTGGPDAIRHLTLRTSTGELIGTQAEVTAGIIAPPVPAPPSIPASLELAGGIRLLGYDVTQHGNQLRVALQWTASASIPAELTAFVHVLNAQGKLVAQNDSPPGGAAFPTTWWVPGEVIPDTHTIELPADLPPGAYQLEIGMYNSKSVERLAVAAGTPATPILLPVTDASARQ